MIEILLLAALASPVAELPSYKGEVLKGLVAGLDSEELYRLEIIGVPARFEMPVGGTPEVLRQSYLFRVEIRNLNAVSCGKSFKKAVALLSLKKRRVRRTSDLRLSFIVSGRDGAKAISLHLDQNGTLIVGDSTGDGSGLLSWLERHLGECYR